MTEKIHKINALSEYFAVIEDYGLDHTISRGEPQKYGQITASAFRPWHDKGRYYGKRELREFYQEIGNQLTRMQRRHFTAFAQHSGFPTNLIDFTTSPLVSLFFASHEQVESGRNGFVYFIRKEKLFSIDQEMEQGYSGAILERMGQDGRGYFLLDKWLQQFYYENRYEAFDYNQEAFFGPFREMVHSLLEFLIEQKEEYRGTDMSFAIKDACWKFQAYFMSGHTGAEFDRLQHALLDLLLNLFSRFMRPTLRPIFPTGS